MDDRIFGCTVIFGRGLCTLARLCLGVVIESARVTFRQRNRRESLARGSAGHLRLSRVDLSDAKRSAVWTDDAVESESIAIRYSSVATACGRVVRLVRPRMRPERDRK